ncbi:MAG: glycyl-radical enzyme activating protein [candidate division Zixibacteria bacterium]|nr:glycyl-radical enzyme activating protein [candidate division Zixibacteria bacterium]
MALTGTIFDLKKYAIHDGPGIRTTVFLKGCPLLCPWCHNPESRNPGVEKLGDNGTVVGRDITVDELLAEIRKDFIFYEESGGGVTFSGGEPMMQTEFLGAVLRVCHDQDIATAVDTSGYAPWDDFERILVDVDLFLFDIKLVDSTAHRTYTGVPVEPVLENLRHLLERGAAVQPRIPLIPGITDTDENLDAIARLLLPMPGIRGVSLLPYNRLAREKCLRFNLEGGLSELQTQSDEDLRSKAGRFESVGLSVRIGG